MDPMISLLLPLKAKSHDLDQRLVNQVHLKEVNNPMPISHLGLEGNACEGLYMIVE